MALPIGFFALFLLHVELSEEVERHHGVQIDDDQGHHDGQDKLLEIVSDRLEDRFEHGEGKDDVDQQKGIEKGRNEHSGHRAGQVDHPVEELVVGENHTRPQPKRVPEEDL